MCEFYDPSVAEKCREDDADEVKNKENANFCDYFRPITGLYDPALHLGERNAREQLDAMFGAESDDVSAAQGTPDSAADDLFK
jgi:hypothetical protein